MKRRDFIKRSVLTAAVFAAGKSPLFAQSGYEKFMRLENRENPTGLEQKHVPGIEAPAKVSADKWFDVKVRVGFMKEHPSTSGHWITMIKLLVDGKEVAVHNFKTGGVSASEALFTIRLQRTSTVEAVENCNLHGTWISGPVKIEIT
jgi:superoxide reductase